MGNRLEFSVLGPLAVRGGGRDLGPAATKPRVLLARLLVDANRSVPATRLVEDLWEGAPPRSAPQTLQSYVSQVRKLLGPDRLLTDAGGYRVVVRSGELDRDRFEALVPDGVAALRDGDGAVAADTLAEALALWRGDAFADAAEASWAAAEIARLDELRLVATESLLEARLAVRDDAGVIAAAEAAVAAHPLRERLWALLMTALYRQGRQADALRAYQRVRRHLGEELGIEPGRELQDLEARMLNQDTELSPVPAPIASPAPGALAAPLLPTGVVTFMLTDVVGSTRLWEASPALMADAIARHEDLLRAAVEAHGGVLLKSRGEGDSTFSVFQRATDAVAAAAAAQAALRAEPWQTPSALEVRSAVHSGEAVERDGDYYGRTVNRVARLRAAAVPGQVVVSQATAELVVDGLPEGLRLQAIGVQQLRDLDRPESLFVVSGVGDGQMEPVSGPDSDRVPLPPRLSDAPAMGFVGRDTELAAVAGALEETSAGSLRVVLLAGEAGIGKTALAAHIARGAHGDGATVLFGRCDDDAGVPYRPWVEALGHFVEHAPRPVLERLGARSAGDLTPLAPAVADRLPGVTSSRSIDAEADRWTLYGAVARLLVEAAADGLVVLVLDDLQWADKPSLVLLRHVVEVARHAPLLIVATYRDSDLAPDHPFTDAVTWLHREGVSDRVAMDGLGDDEVLALVEAAAGQDLGDDARDLVQAVHRETDGNPFFVEALLRHLTESGAVFLDEAGRWTTRADLRDAGLPESVREVIGRRVARLGERCGRVLRAASVVGREFDLVTVARAVGAAEDDVLDALEAADAAGLVVSLSPGRFAFAHAIVANTLYTGLKPTRRERLHRDVAEVIEALDDSGARVAELARHWSVATAPGDRDKAIDCSRRAGDHARRALAPDEAVRWYLHALELLGPDREDAESSRADLLLRLGRVQRDAGDPAHRATLIEAARLAERIGDPDLFIRAALANTLGFVGHLDPESAQRIAVLEAALAAVGEGDSVARTRLLATLAAEIRVFGEVGRVRELADEALAMARRLESPHLLVATLTLVIFAIWAPGTLDERLRLSEEALEQATSLDLRALRHMAAVWRTHALVESGRVDDAAAMVDLMSAIAAETRQPNLQWANRSYRASLAVLQGDLDDGRRLADEAHSFGVVDAALDRDGLRRDQFVAMAWHQGRLEDEAERMRQDWVRALGQDERWREALTGDQPAGPRSSVEEVLARFRVVIRVQRCFVLPGLDRAEVRAAMRAPVQLDPAVTAGWLGAMVMSAELSHRVGTGEDVALLVERLAPYHGHVASTWTVWLGSVAGALAPLAARLGRFDDAERWFAEADEMNERIRAPFFLARNRVGWARMLLARQGAGDAERAGELARSALDIAETHGCEAVVRDAQALLAAPPPLPVRLVAAARTSFVGRRTELAELERAVAEGGQAVLVAGEPGIGKSTLVAIAAAGGRDRGAWTLHGRCDEDLGVPFLPFVEVLTGLVGQVSDAVLDRIGERHLAELARLVPSLADRRPSIPAPQSTDPETERYLLMNAVVAALVEAARVAPVVLVLDDLHWADASSVLLLRHVAAALPGSRVTVLATYRHTDLFADAPLGGALPRLRREAAVVHLTLDGLTATELRDLTGADPQVAEALHRETGGNPFFAAELFRHLRERGDDPASARVPDTVRDLVRQRVAELGDDVLGTLAAASAVGQEFDLDLVAHVLDRDRVEVGDVLDRAEAAALVTTIAPERFAFAHAIVQHALYDEITPTRRARTHRRVAEAITELSPGDGRIAELARHWAHAAVTPDDVAVAVDCAARAAARALDALAPDEAVRWYVSALDLLSRQPLPDQHQRLRVLLGLAEAQVRAGDPAFRRTRLQAGELALALDDADALVRAALTDYQRAFDAGTEPAMQRIIELALERLRGVDSSEHAQLLARYSNEFQFSDPQRAVDGGRAAIAMARRIGDVSMLSRVISFAGATPDRWEELGALTAEAYERARDVKDPSVAFAAARYRALSALQLTDRDGADEAVAWLRDIAADVGRPDMRWVVMTEEAILAVLDGDLRRAERLTEDATVLGRELGQDGAALLCDVLLTTIRWHQGRHRETRDSMVSHLAETPELEVLRLPIIMDDAAGLDLVAAARSLPRDAAWIIGAAVLAEVVARAGDADAARVLYEDLLPHDRLFAISGPSCRGPVAHVLALMARTFGDLGAAEAHFAAADAVNERMRAPFFRARTWLEWGSMLATTDVHRSCQMLERAVDIASDHGYAQVEWRGRRALGR